MTIREEDKVVVLQLSLERDINGELLCLCSAILLGTAVGFLGHGDPGAAPSSSLPRACIQPPRLTG